MFFPVFSVAAFVFVTVLALFYTKARLRDNKNRRLDSIRVNDKAILDEEMEKPFWERVAVPTFTAVLKALSRLFPKRKGSNATQKLERNLRLAGLQINVNEYNAVRVVLTGGLVLLAVIISVATSLGIPILVFLVLISLLLSLALPIFYIRYRTGKRQVEIINQLPDVMDLLSVSIEAGLGFDSALVKIVERMNGILVNEFNMVLTEVQLGKPRRVALKNLADRSPVEELRTFVSSMIQAEQLGIPIKNVLNTQSQQLRAGRKQKAEEKAMKAPVKMMLPLVIFIFPVLFIVLLGPTILHLIEQFG